MAYFKWSGDLNGHKNPIIRELQIPTATAIEKGEIVDFTAGTGVVVVAGTDFDVPMIGVANEGHDGATAGRNVGLKIEVSVSPTAIYRLRSTNVMTATGGSTTTLVDSSILPSTSSFWKGGSIKIISCAADPSLNGRMVKISDNSSTTLTLAETLPAALASGDTYYVCPGPFAIGCFGWDLTSDGTDIDWDTDDAQSLQLYDTNPDTMETFWIPRIHRLSANFLKLA